MSIAPRLIPGCALVLLAACSAPADDAPAKTGAAPAASPAPARPAAPGEDVDLPDWGDPRLFLSLDSLRWAEWETQPPADRDARLRELGIRPIRADSIVEFDPQYGYDPNGERAQTFTSWTSAATAWRT